MMDYAPLRDSARRARQQHTAAAYEASLRQALSYAPVPTGPGGEPRTPTPGTAGAPFVPPPSSHEAPPSPPPRDDLRQSLVRAQQNAQAQLQALVLHQRQLAAALRDLAEGAVPRAEHACRVAGRRGDDAVAAANTVRRELAEQQTQNDAQQRHVRQSIAALRLALDERPTQRQCADLASQTVARWVESDPGAEAWVRRAARSAVGAALGDGGALSAELEDRVARAARTAAAQAAERAAKEIVDKGDFLREAVEAVAQRAGGRVWGDNHKATLRDECAGVAARAASDAVERLVAEYGDRTGAKVAAALEEARVHARAGKEHRDQSAHLLEGATASLAALRKRVDDVDRRHAATHGDSAANVEATLAALLVRLESVERQAPNDPGQPLRALEARLDALAKTATTAASVEAVAANARDAVDAAEAKAVKAQAEASGARADAAAAAARADALEAKLEEVLAAVQQTGARSAQDIGKALQPVAASVAALQKRVEAVEKRPRPAGAPPTRAPPAPIEHEEADASDLSQADPLDDDSVTPGAASRPTFGLPEPATFGLPGSPGNQAATFGLPSMGLAPKLGPLPTTAVEEKKPTAPPAEEVAAQCQYCMKRVPRSRMNAHVAEECKMAFVPCPRGCGKRVLRFALAEHKASCAFGEAGFVPSHTLARTPPARAVASSFPTTDQQESPIGLRGLRSLQRAQPDDAELASLEPLTWSPLRAEEYVSQTLGLPRVGSLLARRHVNGATLAAMSRTDLVRPEPQGLGLAAADADKLFDLVKRLQALSPPS